MANFMWDFSKQKPLLEDKTSEEIDTIFEWGNKTATLSYCEGICGRKPGTGHFVFYVVKRPSKNQLIYRIPMNEIDLRAVFLNNLYEKKYKEFFQVSYMCGAVDCMMEKLKRSKISIKEFPVFAKAVSTVMTDHFTEEK